MTPLLGFLPDVDPSTPGAIVDCTNVIPRAAGLAGAPSAVSVTGVPVLAAECRNAAVTTLLSGSRRVFAGTATKLYELSGGAWSDVSRGGSYTLGTDIRWDIAQFGDASLAAAAGHVIQRSNGSGAFADIAGAPQAKIIEVASDFVVAFNTDAGADVWHCCALLDETDWTASVSTQSNTGRLVSTPGAITAAKTMGKEIVVYKDRSIYIARYLGGNEVWQFDLIPGDIGCIGQDAVTDIGGIGHIFVGRSDILLYDGTRPMSIVEGGLRQWFYNQISQEYLFKTTVLHDKQNNHVWIFYPTQSSTVCDAAIVYHLGTKQWGRVTVSIEAAMNYVTAGVTIDTVGGNIEDLPDVSFDSQYWLSGGRLMTVFNTSHQMVTLTGGSTTSSMTLFEVGDDSIVSRLNRLRVAYQVGPTSASVTGRAKMARGNAYSAGGSGAYSAGKFDIRQSGRFHQLTIGATGDWLASMVDWDFLPAGKR